MNKLAKFVVLTALLSGLMFASTVTIHVVDADNQVWFNGRWQAELVPGPGTPNAVFRLAATGEIVPNQTQSGTLDGSGNATLTLTANNIIGPTGSMWRLTLCPWTTTTCYITDITVTGDASLTFNPPGARITLYITPLMAAYSDTEAIGQSFGSQYYNLTDLCYHTWNGSAWDKFCSTGANPGSVTSFTAGDLVPLFTTGVANPTTAPALSFTLSTAAANSWYGNNTGSTAAPAFHTLSCSSLTDAGSGCTSTAYVLPAQPYDLAGFFPGAQTSATQLLWEISMVRAATCVASLTGSRGRANVAASASTVIDLQKNGVSFGTCTIASQTCSFASAGGVTFAAGDYYQAFGPAVADTTAADISITLACTR